MSPHRQYLPSDDHKAPSAISTIESDGVAALPPQVDRSKEHTAVDGSKETSESAIHAYRESTPSAESSAQGLGLYTVGGRKPEDLTPTDGRKVGDRKADWRASIRANRVESSWEDVVDSSSDDDSDDESQGSTSGFANNGRYSPKTSVTASASTEHDDQWEDEASSADELESDSGLSSATEAAYSQSHGRKRAVRSSLSGGEGGEDDTTIRTNGSTSVNGTPQRSDRIPRRRNSAQRALREYRQSKLALLQTETDNVARYTRLMRGEEDSESDVEGHASGQQTPSAKATSHSHQQTEHLPPPLTIAPPADNRLEIRRTDTMDLLEHTEPFTASNRSDFFDEAVGAARASEIHLSPKAQVSEHPPPVARSESRAEKEKIALHTDDRRGSHSRRSSAVAHSRSPRLPPRLLSSSPSSRSILQSASAIAKESESQLNGSHANGSQRDHYASDPSTPIVTEASPIVDWPETSKSVASSRRSESPEIKRQVASLLDDQPTPTTAKPDQIKYDPDMLARAGQKSSVSPASEKQPTFTSTASTAVPPPQQHSTAKRASRPTPEAIQADLDRLAEATPPFSLWDYLKEEIMASDFDSTQEMKWERVTNFIAIPFWMEKIMLFGFFVCLDSFLYTFTILPIRFIVAVFVGIRNQLVWLAGGSRRYLSSSHKCDLLKTVLIVMSCYILSRITDASQMYHSVRGQDVVKLYVIFNVLEIADRLCCSFGQDLLDSLFSRSTLARRKDGKQPFLRPLGFFTLSLLYVLAHTLVLLYQLVTLNVAINSYDNALLTLLLSNQFVEIKGSVFKKFEKENLFQLTCADIVERFQLTLMLGSIGLRNLIEVAGAASNSISSVRAQTVGPGQLLDGHASQRDISSSSAFKASSPLSAIAMLGPLPTSFTVFPSFSLLETIFTPVCIVLASEFLVDWLKHAFITKFNHIRPAVYGRFMDVLCRDLILAGPVRSSSRRRHTFVDQSPVVSRRLGFAAVPLACLLVRMTSQVMGMLHDDSHFDECSVPELQRNVANSEGEANFTTSVVTFVSQLSRRPFVALLRPLSSDPNKALDLVLFYFWSASAWILTVTIAWVFLVALKLLLGTNLSHFAARRYATMAQREKEEELNARDRQPIGVDKEEMAYDAKIAQLVDRADDDASRVGLNGAPLPIPVKHKPNHNKSSHTDSLMDVSRYTMVRSRIW